MLPSDKMGLLDAPGIFLYGCHSANVNSDVLSTVSLTLVIIVSLKIIVLLRCYFVAMVAIR